MATRTKPARAPATKRTDDAVARRAFLDDHHGDGIVAVTMKVPPGENARMADDDPTRFYLPAYLAKSGWVALRLDVGRVDRDEVRALVAGSYRAVAPKKLAAQVSA